MVNRKNRTSRRGFFRNLTVTTKLIIFTSLFSLIGFLVFGIYPSLGDYFYLKAGDILAGRNLWTLVTHMFLHANFVHLFVNMFSLYFIGRFVEVLIGGKRFIRFYIIAGVLAGVIFVLFAYLGTALGLERVLGSLSISAVGASGALFGLLGILAVLIPDKRVSLIAGPLFIIILQIILDSFLPANISLTLDIVLNLLIFFMIFAMLSPNPRIFRLSIPVAMPLWVAPIVAIFPLVIVSFFVSLPIGNTAHLGGLLVGLVYGYYLRTKYKKKVALLERVFK